LKKWTTFQLINHYQLLREKTSQEPEFSTEKIKVLETDIECNSYNRKIGANNKSMSSSNKKNLRGKLMLCSMHKPYKYMTCSKRPNLSIINIESKMKWTVIMLMPYSLNRRETVKSFNIKNGPDKKSTNLTSLQLMTS